MKRDRPYRHILALAITPNRLWTTPQTIATFIFLLHLG